MMIEAVISMMRYLSSRKDDDVVDRMNYLYTPNMLLAFSVLISFKQFGGKLPSFLWKCASLNSGIRVHEIVERACDSQNMEDSFYFMNWFLHTDKYTWYGFDVVWDIIRGQQWETSGYFPRVSICDFTIRQVANIQKYSVQCVLVINIFNEKIFILLWFWYVILAFCTLVSFFYWTVIISFSCFGSNFVQSNLELSELELDTKQEKKRVIQFVNDYLKMDGIFVLRMVSFHAGVIFGTELVAELYKSYHNIQDPGHPYPVPSYYDSNLEATGLRKRKKSKNYDDEDDEAGTMLIPMGSPGNEFKEDDRNSSNNESNQSNETSKSTNEDVGDQKSQHSNIYA